MDALASTVRLSDGRSIYYSEEGEGTPLLLIHGSRDELLPVRASEMVRFLADHGELEVIDGAGHLFDGHGDDLHDRVGSWLGSVWD